MTSYRKILRLRSLGFSERNIAQSWYQPICSGESILTDATMDRISYASYQIDIESIAHPKTFQ